ncbi:hypothetical protein OC845_002909 [Tilletia horrida]|nr:hypothetical protein OC845_002909 [Tilletia horrida]
MSFAGKKKGGFSLGTGSTPPVKSSLKASPSSKGKGRATHGDDDDEADEDDEDEIFQDDDDFDDEDEDDDFDLDAGAQDDDEPDTDEEIEAAKAAQSQSSKTAKRKRRATSPGAFGATLQSLLGAGPSGSADDEGPDSEDDGADTDDGEDADEDDDDDENVRQHKKARKLGPPAGAPPSSINTFTTAGGAAGSRPSAILSLAPHLRRTLQSQKINAKAARLAIQQRKMREERAHITDVISGWGPPGVAPGIDEEAWERGLAAKKERKNAGGMGAGSNLSFGKAKMLLGGVVSVDETDEEQRAWLEEGGSRAYERKLRKVAQRGVVKLFNAIRAAQTTSMDDVEAVAASAPSSSSSKPAQKPTAVQGGKEAALTNLSKTNFLDLIRSGSKAKV